MSLAQEGYGSFGNGHPANWARFRVGMDVRPALVPGAGISRYTRELVAALTRLPEGPFLEAYAPTWRVERPVRTPASWVADRFRLHHGFLPARFATRIHRLPGLDAGRWPARVEVFHWTDYVYPMVRSAAVVLTLHDTAFTVDPSFHGPNTPVLLARVRSALPHAHRVIVVSEPGRTDAERMGIDPERIRVVPNGVEPRFRPLARGAAERGGPHPEFLLTVGTLEPRKNHLRLLRVLEELWDRGAAPDWVLVGRVGWECETLLAALRTSRHAHRIHWKGRVDEEELLPLLQSCTALLYPSLYEGFGLPVLEAMACARPVLVGSETAPAWVAGEAAVAVDPRDPEALRNGILRILADPVWRTEAGTALAERAARFRWDDCARRTLSVYREAREVFLTERETSG